MESKENDGGGIYIGVVPSDIDQKTLIWSPLCHFSYVRKGYSHRFMMSDFFPGSGVHRQEGRFF